MDSYDDSLAWLIFQGEQLVVTMTGSLPHWSDLTQFTDLAPAVLIADLAGKNYYTTILAAQPETLPEGFQYKTLRQLAADRSQPLTRTAFHHYHIYHWLQKNRFCPACATPLARSEKEEALCCPACHNTIYPKISPAMIVAVTKGNQILLARGSRFKVPMFSTLAGFAEAGESLEECVAREVHEEVGISVKNIRYFGSQPWPFPDSLMIAFTAEWESGELAIDQEEILAADWFSADDLPRLPMAGSIARRLIDAFCADQKQ